MFLTNLLFLSDDLSASEDNVSRSYRLQNSNEERNIVFLGFKIFLN
jgi:hypothetical protein